MPVLNKIPTMFLAVRELGIHQTVLFGLYRLGLITGHYRRVTLPGERVPEAIYNFRPVLHLPSPNELGQLSPSSKVQAILAADEICRGFYRPFGGAPEPLSFVKEADIQHWTKYKTETLNGVDIKMIWEAARFGWALTLGRAFLFSQESGYAQTFWKLTESFLDANRPNLGPNWISAQEVSLRIIAFAFCLQIFADSPHTTLARKNRLITAIVQHAERIPPTLLYARAQYNNHLLSEAVGLYTAGIVIPEHPSSNRWRAVGLKWFNHAIQSQISPDGTYIQHSTNYHRLMLHLAMWMKMVADQGRTEIPQSTLEKLAAATHWLSARMDPISGKASNLGHNDGSNIFPLAAGEIHDYRPVLQAASRIFLGKPSLPAGDWDELGIWLSGNPKEVHINNAENRENDQINHGTLTESGIRILPSPDGWASLRAVQFSGRPAHADQLNVEIWSQGVNIALDAGTYLYNASPPWENSLTSTLAHNTISMDGQDQMIRAGRFLWLKRAKAKFLDVNVENSIKAEHDGYHRLGIHHVRSLSLQDSNTWQIEDELLPIHTHHGVHEFCLHWLFPDWPWQINGNSLWINNRVEIVLNEGSRSEAQPAENIQIIRAGELIHGEGKSEPFLGWYSPTYGVKIPALSVRYVLKRLPPIRLVSTIHIARLVNTSS